MTPTTHVSGWRQWRNAHHHSAPTIATMKPQSRAGRSLFDSPWRPVASSARRWRSDLLAVDVGRGDVRLVAQPAQELRLDHDALPRRSSAGYSS